MKNNFKLIVSTSQIKKDLLKEYEYILTLESISLSYIEIYTHLYKHPDNIVVNETDSVFKITVDSKNSKLELMTELYYIYHKRSIDTEQISTIIKICRDFGINEEPSTKLNQENLAECADRVVSIKRVYEKKPINFPEFLEYIDFKLKSNLMTLEDAKIITSLTNEYQVTKNLCNIEEISGNIDNYFTSKEMQDKFNNHKRFFEI